MGTAWTQPAAGYPPQDPAAQQAANISMNDPALMDEPMSPPVMDRESSLLDYLRTRKTKNRVDTANELEKMSVLKCLAQDHYELLKTTLHMGIEIFKVIMACMLTIVVPQRCGDHSCSIGEAFEDLTDFNKIALAVNFITLGVTMLHFYLVFRRERMLIRYLDEDENEAERHLIGMLAQFPLIDDVLNTIHRRVFLVSFVTFAFSIGNPIVSAFLLFRDDRWDGYRTGTVFATNVLLIFNVVQKAMYYSFQGWREKIALSCVEFEPVSYNTIDRQYLHTMRQRTHASINVQRPDGSSYAQTANPSPNPAFAPSPVPVAAPSSSHDHLFLTPSAQPMQASNSNGGLWLSPQGHH